MSLLKNTVRYNLARLAQGLGLSPFIRKWYLTTAQTYALRLNKGLLEGAWVRRSVTNQDFVPFLSDIDLTLIIDEKRLSELRLPSSLLVKDVQLVPSGFKTEWLRTGGFRNYQQHKWIPLKDSENLSPKSVPDSKAILAFELSHEIYLLYHQFEKNLHAFPDALTINSLKKIKHDIEKVKQFWKYPTDDVLGMSREKFPTSISLEQFIQEFDLFCSVLRQSLDSPLDKFNCLELAVFKHPQSTALNLNFLGKPVMIVDEPAYFSEILRNFPEHFVAMKSFIDLFKGVGVQEQTLLNQLAQKDAYYFEFNKQRLALDLVGAVALAPDNHGQLYYCFKSIHDFSAALSGNVCPDWDKIHKLWEEEGLIARSTADLHTLTNAYLEVLNTLG